MHHLGSSVPSSEVHCHEFVAYLEEEDLVSPLVTPEEDALGASPRDLRSRTRRSRQEAIVPDEPNVDVLPSSDRSNRASRTPPTQRFGDDQDLADLSYRELRRLTVQTLPRVITRSCAEAQREDVGEACRSKQRLIDAALDL